jgi:hypothetical protein
MNETLFNTEDLAPSLREAFGERQPNPEKLLAIGVPVKDPENPSENAAPVPAAKHNRSELVITSGKEVWFWTVPSLTELFRGDKEPPVLGDFRRLTIQASRCWIFTLLN